MKPLLVVLQLLIPVVKLSRSVYSPLEGSMTVGLSQTRRSNIEGNLQGDKEKKASIIESQLDVEKICCERPTSAKPARKN